MLIFFIFGCFWYHTRHLPDKNFYKKTFCGNDQNQKYYCIGFTRSPPKSCFLKIFVLKRGSIWKSPLKLTKPSKILRWVGLLLALLKGVWWFVTVIFWKADFFKHSQKSLIKWLKQICLANNVNFHNYASSVL